MKADLLKRLFKAIFTEDIVSLKKIANAIVHDERRLGHNVLADALENISVSTKARFSVFPKTQGSGNGVVPLPTSKRTNAPLVSNISREHLKHHMVLPPDVETRLLSIEKEYAARERLFKYNLKPKQKVLLHGPPGCGKTLSAERIAWNLGLPLVKVRFDSLISSYFGESASNLRAVFEYCKNDPVVLLLDECDFIAKSRVSTQDVGEVPRIVNMLLTLLDEYDSPGLVIATTNLKVSLDEALFRRFDDVIELPMPQLSEREKLIKMTLSSIPVSHDVDYSKLAHSMDGCSPANIVLTTQRTAKICVLEGAKSVDSSHFELALNETSKF